jgi:hypothetical protein
MQPFPAGILFKLTEILGVPENGVLNVISE